MIADDGKPNNLENEDGNTQAMLQALKGQIPDKKNKHDPKLKNDKGQTVALILASQGIVPPKEWNHDCDIQDGDCYTVEEYLEIHQLPIPNNWIRDKNKQKNKPWFQQAIYNESIISKNIDPKEQNSDGWTIAMIQAVNGKIPEERFKYNDDIKNKYGQTVEDIMRKKDVSNSINEESMNYQQSQNQQQPQFQGQQFQQNRENYNLFEQDQYNIQQSSMLVQNDHIYNRVPNRLQSSLVTRDLKGNTPAMQQAEQGHIPDQEKQHDPRLKNNRNQTVAHMLAKNGIIPPREWEHEPELFDNTQQTVALYLAGKGIIPPEQWHHDPTMKSKKGFTVQFYLLQNNQYVPPEWQC